MKKLNKKKENIMVTIDKLLDDEKDVAIKFLKKVFSHENNLQLSEIKKGLELDFILRHLDNIKINDILEKKENNINNINIDKVKKTRTNKIEMDIFNNFVFEIISKNEKGIETNEIIIFINNNMKIKVKKITIYDRLLNLKKKGILDSYRFEKKCYWIKNQDMSK